mgnify:CR=1 FL=1
MLRKVEEGSQNPELPLGKSFSKSPGHFSKVILPNVKSSGGGGSRREERHETCHIFVNNLHNYEPF